MPTTAKGTPYVQSSDLVSAYPTTSLSLANHIDNNLAFNALTYVANTGTSYSFVAADATAGKLVTQTNAAASTYTIPPQSSVAWATGAVLRIVNLGVGVLSVVGGAGVTVNNAASGLTQYESAPLIRTASDTWQMLRGGALPKASYSSNTGAFSVDSASRPGKTIVTFNGSGTLTCGTAGLVEVLCIGGGGGGNINGGGGGAGGYVEDTSRYIPVTTAITITVGAGGPVAGNGQTSVVGTFVVGVGGGAPSRSATNYGGSGAGATSDTASIAGTGVSGQGHNGGTRVAGTAGGGGGGAAAAGANGAATVGGNGGAGISSSITGSAVTRGGGGGGAGSVGVGSGGTGGGGNGSVSGTANNGSANTGGGGGGAFSGTAATGGTGVVIVVFG